MASMGWFFITVAIAFRIKHKEAKKDPKELKVDWMNPIKYHAGAIVFYSIITIWFTGPIVNFLWTSSMLASIVMAIMAAKLVKVHHFDTFALIFMITAAAIILNELLFTLILSYQIAHLKVILHSFICLSMDLFQWNTYKSD